MIFKRTYIFHLLAITLLLFIRSSTADDNEINRGTSSVYAEEAARFLQNIDQSVNPCSDFFNFACGGYMKKSDADAVSPGYGRYLKLMDDIEDILESERDIPGSDVSTARNIYINCMKIVPDDLKKQEIIETIATEIGLIKSKYIIARENVIYNWNEQFNWIDGVLKLRQMGLNFRFLIGLYVNPRSQTDKRNILEIREPFLESDNVAIIFNSNKDNLTIVNAGEYFNSLNGSFPLQKLIEGLLPKDTNFSLEDEIRVDDTYIKTLVNESEAIPVNVLVQVLFEKLESEIEKLLPPKNISFIGRVNACVGNAIYYDFNFQVAVSKTFFTEKKKDFVTKILSNVLETTKILINSSQSFDEESRTKSINKLLNLQLMIAYSNNTIESPALDWNHVDYQKYVNNIFTLSKHQMDSKFRQLNLVNDVREWEAGMIPSTYNAAFYSDSNSLYVPALFLTAEMHKLDLPSYIHYGSIGFTMAHELGHVIDISTINFQLKGLQKYNFAGLNVRENKKCLRRAYFNLTLTNKQIESEDFADLAAYRIAYYTFLNLEKKNGNSASLPGLNYNSRQMFWITSANAFCSKNAFNLTTDGMHSPDFARVLLPLPHLPEFAKDFNCPIGSSMNPKTKCEFL